MTFKEMRILRVILHLRGQKPTFDIKKIFRMNCTRLLMTTLLTSQTEGGINGPTGRSRSRSSEILPPSPLTCQAARAGPVLCSYQNGYANLWLAYAIGSFKGCYYPSKVELLNKAHGTTQDFFFNILIKRSSFCSLQINLKESHPKDKTAMLALAKIRFVFHADVYLILSFVFHNHATLVKHQRDRKRSIRLI